MSTKKEINVSTVSELVSLVLQSKSFQVSRWTINETYDWIHEDEKGKELSRPCRLLHYELIEAGNHWSPQHIKLSNELGKMIDGIWTKREPYRQASYKVNSGALSLKGILKRLNADEGLAEQIKKQEEIETARANKLKRNNARARVRKSSQELYELLINNNVIDWNKGDDESQSKGSHFFEVLSKLQNLIDEE